MILGAPDVVRAQVWLGGQEFELREFAVPELAPGEALVAVDLATICGSDLHTVSGRRPGAHPGILGHEVVGHVVAVADEAPAGVDGVALQVGDRVVWSVTSACGTCDRCAAGRSAKCRALLKTGHEPLDGPWPLSGGHASHVHLRAGTAAVRVPSEIPDASAAMAACALATACACVEAAAGPGLGGARVLVVGAGMLGLCAAALARSAGAVSVAVAELDPERAHRARELGADTVITPPATPEGGVDVAIELSGHPDGVALAIGALDVGGRAALAGSVTPGAPVPIDPERVVRRHLGIVGVHNYEPRHLAAAVDFLAESGAAYDWPGLVADPVALDDLPAAFASPVGGILRRSITPAS
ncbi:alcohol dehydrogenase catalytic domain-containing protein [Mobilicoccus massiliensis]|uniref:alcohol dehydrogenase catalytic domain-containing protein n=1 Tax=Mobilicoccus massiliensis TaxID=1522310 RepID=UPI00058CF3DF|nr:alcohol dehydrogenase catalytic domain-containing protein [Mobilicoccus massiliensis]